jgi:hypothetical protein
MMPLPDPFSLIFDASGEYVNDTGFDLSAIAILWGGGGGGSGGVGDPDPGNVFPNVGGSGGGGGGCTISTFIIPAGKTAFVVVGLGGYAGPPYVDARDDPVGGAGGATFIYGDGIPGVPVATGGQGGRPDARANGGNGSGILVFSGGKGGVPGSKQEFPQDIFVAGGGGATSAGAGDANDGPDGLGGENAGAYAFGFNDNDEGAGGSGGYVTRDNFSPFTLSVYQANYWAAPVVPGGGGGGGTPGTPYNSPGAGGSGASGRVILSLTAIQLPEVSMPAWRPPDVLRFAPADARRNRPTLFNRSALVSPSGQAAQALQASQIPMPRYPAGSPVPGPWKPFPRQPELLRHLERPPAPPDTRPPLGYPLGSPVPGPWNRFRALGAVGSPPAVPTVPPPPPVPAFGPGRAALPLVPRAPEADGRLRPFVDKVAGVFNGLIRAGHLLGDGSGWRVLSGAVVLPRAPLPTDDATVGATVGQRFVNTLDQSVWVCVQNSPGAAVWKRLPV